MDFQASYWTGETILAGACIYMLAPLWFVTTWTYASGQFQSGMKNSHMHRNISVTVKTPVEFKPGYTEEEDILSRVLF